MAESAAPFTPEEIREIRVSVEEVLNWQLEADAWTLVRKYLHRLEEAIERSDVQTARQYWGRVERASPQAIRTRLGSASPTPSPIRELALRLVHLLDIAHLTRGSGTS